MAKRKGPKWTRPTEPIPEPIPVPSEGTDTGVIIYTQPAASSGAATFSATWTVNSTGPITMGLVAPQGQLPSGYGVQVGSFTTQTDVLNTWPDGSTRHAMVSFNATSTGAKSVVPIANPGGSYTPTFPSASVAFLVGATTYTATMPAFSGSWTSVCNGAVARRAWIMVTPLNGGTPHATLQVIFEVTSYAVGGHKVGIAIQNIRNLSTMDQVTADVTTTINGSGATNLTKSGWTIYTGQRWYRTNYVSMTEAVVLHDFEPWIAANVIPRITAADVHTYDLTDNNHSLGGGTIGGAGFYFGDATANQGDSESSGRQELNPWTDWEARLFCLNTETYRGVVLANGNQSGGWCWQIDKDGDGTSLLKITDGTNAADVTTDRSAAISGGDGLQWPSFADVGGTAAWRGAFDAGNSTAGNTVVDREHLPEMNFIPYLLTGDRFYLDQLRFQASWAIFQAPPGYTQSDTFLWPSYFRGRNGTAGLLDDTEMGRGFGRPLKFVLRAAWAMPDALSADQTYFTTIAQNNLDKVGTYIDYLDSRGWGGSWATTVGMFPNSGGEDNRYARNGAITSTTGASPTVITVTADATVANANDHGMQTGDYVTHAGFSGGASGLNGQHVVIRVSATQYSVAVNTTGSATAGVGTWDRTVANQLTYWRVTTTGREVAWAGYTGLFTMTSSIWAFVDRLVQMGIAYQDQPNFDTTPGISYQIGQAAMHVVGNDYVFYNSWAALEGANNPSTTAEMFHSEAVYTAAGVATHRGCKWWNPAQPNEYYTPYVTTMLAYGRRRGVSGASAAYTRIVAASDVLTELTRRPGFYMGVP